MPSSKLDTAVEPVTATGCCASVPPPGGAEPVSPAGAVAPAVFSFCSSPLPSSREKKPFFFFLEVDVPATSSILTIAVSVMSGSAGFRGLITVSCSNGFSAGLWGCATGFSSLPNQRLKNPRFFLFPLPAVLSSTLSGGREAASCSSSSRVLAALIRCSFARLFPASAWPCCAAFSNQCDASVSLCLTPSPIRYMLPRRYWASPYPCSAERSYQRDARIKSLSTPAPR